MHFLGAGILEHADDLFRRRAADDGVIDHHKALAGHVIAQGIELEPHAELAELLRRLDERAGDIAVLDEALAVGSPSSWA